MRVDDLPVDAWPQYRLSYDAGSRAGRNGVAVLARWAPSAVRTGFGSRSFDHEGRYLEVDPRPAGRTTADRRLAVLPKGGNPDYGPEAAKQRRKLRFMASFGRYLTRVRWMRKRPRARCSATSTSSSPGADLANPTANLRQPGFRPDERQWFGRLLGPRTLVDVVRSLHPHDTGPFSGGTWRGQAWGNDTGWRIDYHLASPALAAGAATAAPTVNPVTRIE